MSLNLITDRTQTDVDNAYAEIEAAKESLKNGNPIPKSYFDGLRGCYSYIDFNRVESAVDNIYKRLNDIGFDISITTKTNWKLGDNPTSELSRYLSNITELRSKLTLYATTPQAPDDFNPYTKANDIEKILQDIDIVIEVIHNSWYYSGETFSAEL